MSSTCFSACPTSLGRPVRSAENPRSALCPGGAGLIFKGEGFYITDYRSDAYKKAASSDKEAASSEKKASSGDSAGKSSEGKDSSGRGRRILRRERRIFRRGRRILRRGFEQVEGGLLRFFGRIEELPVRQVVLIGLLTRFGRS